MNLDLAFQTFLYYVDCEREKIAACKLKEIAKSENLDDFLGIKEYQPGVFDYFTTPLILATQPRLLLIYGKFSYQLILVFRSFIYSLLSR